MDYSTKTISTQLLDEIKSALQSVNFGSIEIYVSDSNVTQITTRTIKKTTTTIGKTTSKKKTPSNGKTKKYIVGNMMNFNADR